MSFRILHEQRRSSWALGLMAGTGIGLAVLLVSLSPSARSADEASDRPVPVITGPVSFADVVEQVSPAVVNIAVEKAGAPVPTGLPGLSRRGTPFDEFFGRFFERPEVPDSARRPRSQALGAGFIVDADGYIVTNHHVIEGADRVIVRFADGEEAEARIVGRDPKTDLALLKVDTGEALPFVAFGDSDRARVGDWVLAIGNPFGLGGSATAGIISARGRDIRSGPYDDYLQIDAPINSGNSGGPVFNGAGQVIGVNTAIISPNGGNIGIGLAIPARQAAAVVAALKQQGSVTRGWLGVQIQGLDGDLAEALDLGDSRGALIAEVMSNSPADQAGLLAGDVITHFDGERIDDARHLSRVVANARPGESVEVEILREGHQRKIEVKLGNSEPALTAGGPASRESSLAAGLTLRDLTAADRERNNLNESVDGALVVAVEAGSPADQKGIRPGDVITAVNHRNVRSVTEALSMLGEAERDGDRALLLMRRGDAQIYVALNLA